MNVRTKFLIILCLVFAFGTSRAQNSVEVSPPELSLKNGKVHVDYDLLNSSRSEKFTVRIEISDDKGDLVPARSLSGDIGKGVNGGGNKKIIWDIGADSIFLDGDVFVEVYAMPETPPVAQTPPEETQEETKDDTREEVSPSASGSKQKQFNRTAIILQSIAFPGLGLSRVNPGKPHWIRGVAGYGCLAGSVYLNRKSWSTYQDYLNPEHPGAKDDLFDQAYDSKKTSQILGYAAVGVWVADLVWTILGTSDMNQNQLSYNPKASQWAPAWNRCQMYL